MADLLSAITILMVFLTFLFQAIDKEITNQINKPLPNVNKSMERKDLKIKLRNLLILKSIPITLVYAITSYTLLPKSVSIIHHSKINFWNFDPLNTIFIYINVGAIMLTIYSTVKMIQLIKKLISA